MVPDENDVEYEEREIQEFLKQKRKKVIPREDQCPEYYEDDDDVSRQERE